MTSAAYVVLFLYQPLSLRNLPVNFLLFFLTPLRLSLAFLEPSYPSVTWFPS
jgi:hypothetical protein